MKVRHTKLLAVLTAAVMTLASGTIQAYASVCQPAEKATQDACCPDDSQVVQAQSCTMDGCNCSIDTLPTQNNDSPAVAAAKAQTLDVPVTADSVQEPSFDAVPHDTTLVVSHRERAPPNEPDTSGHGLRAPPSQRA